MSVAILNMPLHVLCSSSSCYGIGLINVSGILHLTTMGKAAFIVPSCFQLQPQDVVSLQAVRQAMGVAPFVPQPQDVYAVKNSGIDV